MDELKFAQQFAPSGPPTINDVFARAMRADRAEQEAARAEATAAADREAARENMALVNRQLGDPLGQLTRSQMAVAEARDRVRALEDQLEDARRVLHRAAGEYVDWQEQAEMVTASARRSSDPDMLADAKRALAEHQVDAMLAARSQAPGPHPKGRGGHAIRSEPAACEGCRNVGFTQAQSDWTHKNVKALAEIKEMGELADAIDGVFSQDRADAERHRYDRREISR